MTDFMLLGDTIYWIILIDTYIDNFISKNVDPFFEITCETIDKWFINSERIFEFVKFMNLSFYFANEQLKFRMSNKKYKMEIHITNHKCVSRHYIITCCLMSNIGKIAEGYKNIKLVKIDCEYPIMIPPKNKIKMDDIYLCYPIIYQLAKRETIIDFHSLFDQVKIIIMKHKEKKKKQIIKLKQFLIENEDIRDIVKQFI